MDARVDFDINDSLKNYDIDPSSIATPEAPQELVDCENDPESLTPALVNSELNPVIDAVAESPDAITRSSYFDTLQFLLKCVPAASRYTKTYATDPNCDLFGRSRYSAQIPPAILGKILDLIVSALSTQADVVHSDLEADEQETLQHHKKLLEMYGFLLRWTISAVETRALEKSASAPTKGRKGAKSKSGASKDGSWDASAQLETALDRMSKVLKLKLARIFVTTSERDTFISLFTKPVYHILENEARVKNTAIRMHCFRVLCIAAKHHGHAYSAQTAINQNLTYFEHLSEPMAEFLQILGEQYDYPQLTEEVLRDLSNKEFSSTDLKGPKSVSTFLTKISDLSPHIVIKQMTLLANLLDSESYTLRCALIEVCGNLVAMLSKQTGDERSETHKAQIRVFFDVLEERFLDMNPYCRCRVIQVYVKLCDLEQKFPKRRQTVAELAARSLEDKSSNVRRNAIKLLGKLVSTHPFTALHGGLLSTKEWTTRLEECESQINALKPPEELREKAPGDQTVDETLLQDATMADNAPEEGGAKHPSEMTDEEKAAAIKKTQEEAATAQVMDMLQKTRKYYLEALKFIEVVDEAAEVVTLLLSSKNKSEVIEAMDFFTVIDAYKIPNARSGIRRMLRLIWTKGNSDEGKGVQTHLIECYKGLFFDAPPEFNPNDAANYIAKNMISLTFGTTPAELTSLEQLLSTMMKQGLVNALVIQKLWQIYGYQKKTISRNQRRGAIIVLGMLALAVPDIIVQEMETCLRIGLGELGRRDLGLARYTCIALRRISAPPGKQAASASPVQTVKLPNDHAVLVRLADMTEIVSDSKEWFGVAEQAISAIYVLSKHPDVLCSDILRRKTKYVFASQTQPPPSSSDSVMEDISQLPTPLDEQAPDIPVESQPQAKKQNSTLALSQLLFVVGHVAIKQIVHLELCEQEFKRRKAEKEKKTTPTPRKSLAAENPSPVKKGRKKANKEQTPASEEVDELDLMAGTTEDDFTEAIAQIREQELLYGPQSLLANFGPLVSDICTNNTSYNHPTLQAQAALCLAKLMCVSSEYCEQNLGLLLTILERSKDAVVRSNLVVALGDMAVCFNHLIDENTDFLYRRLNDGDLSVKRTCLMTLTFLILAGQVKVKGQLSEMAKCLEDSDRKIADMARMFFSELATKDNAVYNQFVDMFSVLSADTGLNEDAFKRIIKFLAGFIEKDKHAKQLSNKLAARLPRAGTERQWSDVAYTLGLLQHKDEQIQKMVSEGFKVVQTAA
ncbi:armadillo-type protein [Massariosphaeria phaeospora]|uniref:Condensin complex subunit 1 n=1 Tax=Massariosphaeria phaeospora TaxID=100035 RepID=A0A7C8IHG6_9PLEO|nr:armadillo-type protein [Massariosphaeria phaeospora]